jgi:DNA-binding HxlR family transcriptional regulator
MATADKHIFAAKMSSAHTLRKIWYNLSMDTIDQLSTTINQPQTTAHTEAACATSPMGRAIRLLGDMWILLIVINLLHGPKRFNELRDLMGHVSPKTLSQRLKMLEEIQFVERRAFLEIPPRVEYRLTKKGLELDAVIRSIEQFAQQNLADIEPLSPDTSSSSHTCLE